MRLGVGGRAHLAQDGHLARGLTLTPNLAPPLTLTLNPNPGAHPNPFTLTLAPWAGHLARGRDRDLPRATRAAEVRSRSALYLPYISPISPETLRVQLELQK